ncbi:Fic family protein, partial [Candidatus Woesearchaeota archaeon]|nr:Fic family protein [Candidatus Woesearchaeota archaeon]
MYLEKRKAGKNVKYYLVHSYRENNRVEKIRRYIGSNLTEKELEEKRLKAEKIIEKIIEKI